MLKKCKFIRYLVLLPQLFQLWEISVVGQMLFKKEGNDLRLIDLNPRGKSICNHLLSEGDLLCEQMPNHREVIPHYNQSLIEIYLEAITSNKPREVLIQYDGEVSGWYRNSMFRPRKQYLFMSFIDVTAEKNWEFIDPLTGLYNSRYLNWVQKDAYGAICVDLDDADRLKKKTSTKRMDLVLVKIASGIKEIIKSHGWVLIKGLTYDEFFLTTGNSPPVEVFYLAEKILLFINTLKVGDYSLSASIGIANSIKLENAITLIDRAELAMSSAKRDKATQTPKARIRVWDKALSVKRTRRDEIQEQLRFAVDREELRLVYQGIFDISRSEVVGCETLLRWDSPLLGVVSPGEFIPIAEIDSLISAIEKWVVQQVLRLPYPRNSTLRWVSVNLTPTEIERHEIIDLIKSRDTTEGCCLSIEITERKLANNSAKFIRNLRHLNNLGITIKLDDFGTGSAGLTQVLQLPIQYIKVDRILLPRTRSDVSAIIILTAIQKLFSALDKDIIVEGVETSEQLDIIKEIGIKYAQGYLLGRPVPWEQFCQAIK